MGRQKGQRQQEVLILRWNKGSKEKFLSLHFALRIYTKHPQPVYSQEAGSVLTTRSNFYFLISDIMALFIITSVLLPPSQWMFQIMDLVSQTLPQTQGSQETGS